MLLYPARCPSQTVWRFKERRVEDITELLVGLCFHDAANASYADIALTAPVE